MRLSAARAGQQTLRHAREDEGTSVLRVCEACCASLGCLTDDHDAPRGVGGMPPSRGVVTKSRFGCVPPLPPSP